MSEEQKVKTIFTGHKEYLEKSFLEELNYKIWSTKGARFEADKRLTIVAKMSNISLSILSAYLIIASLISVYNLHSEIKIELINYVVTALSILLLVLSQYENAQNYSLRAKDFHNCGLELSSLYNQLRLFKTLNPNSTENEKREFAIKLSQEYQNVLARYENHISIDYDNFKLAHLEYFKNVTTNEKILIQTRNFLIRYFWYSIIIVFTPILIICLCIFI
ncbi:SLATT domain-containing protein [Empedobacter sp.]|uniref:SLATT domain-containing protein n=1 Tax=Empedobacter sp. TaxID=1927715 RepID=UPI002896A435|nr:SLATT domain-containing protein [Empedobacter sp.]